MPRSSEVETEGRDPRGAPLPPEPDAPSGASVPSWLDTSVLYDSGIEAGAKVPAVQSRSVGASDLGVPSDRDPVAEFFGRAKEIGTGLAEVERGRGESIERMERDYTGLLDRDRQQMQKAFEATSAAKDAIPPPWDADRERAARINDPIANFGSIGSIFAMVASAFTRAPMTSALNASAAAMIAMRNNDEKAYESAYDAWQKNTQLALKRFDMEKTGFDQAQHLLTTDMNAWRQAMLVNAAKFDNRKAVFMLQNGMDKELIETMAAGSRTAAQVAETYEKIQTFEIKRQIYRDSERAFAEANPDATEAQKLRNRLETIQDLASGRKTTEETLLRRFYAENPHATAEEARDFLTQLRLGSRASAPAGQALAAIAAQVRAEGTLTEEGDIWEEALRRRAAANQAPQRGPKAGSEQEFITRRTKELVDQAAAKGETLSETEATKQAAKEWTASRRADPVRTRGRQIAEEIDRRKENYIAGGMDEGEAFRKASKEVQLESRTMSGNEAARVQRRVDTIGYARDTLDKAETLLNKHWGITGLGGTITRAMESVSNATGISDATDRRQFERFISELKEWGPQIFLDRSGRPLSAEAANMSRIIAGLSIGDTSANTKRAFIEMRPLWNKIQEQLMRQLGDDWNPASGPGSPPRKIDDDWRKAPGYIPGGDKRSSADGSFQVAGDVVPGPFAPSGTAGPAPLEQAINPSGPNIIKLPRDIIKDYIRRRSWSELERAVNAQDVG